MPRGPSVKRTKLGNVEHSCVALGLTAGPCTPANKGAVHLFQYVQGFADITTVVRSWLPVTYPTLPNSFTARVVLYVRAHARMAFC